MAVYIRPFVQSFGVVQRPSAHAHGGQERRCMYIYEIQLFCVRVDGLVVEKRPKHEVSEWIQSTYLQRKMHIQRARNRYFRLKPIEFRIYKNGVFDS